MSATRAPTRHRSPTGRLLRSRGGAALRRLLPRVVVALSYVLFRSCRIRFIGQEHEDRFTAPDGQFIFAAWHEGLIMLPYHFSRLRHRPPVVMVSASRDGDVIAGAIERFGLRAVRGSSGRAGSAALKTMIRALRDPSCIGAGIIVDGPKGPPLVAKTGVILLARATGLPIVPGTWWARPLVRFKSWDRTIVPVPFARLVFVLAEPLFVPRDADDAAMQALADTLTERLMAARRRAQSELGLNSTA